MKRNTTFLLLFFCVILRGFTQIPGEESVHLSVSGSSTIQPAAEHAAQLYLQQYGNAVDVRGGGSGAGVRNALSGISDIGMASRSLTPGELEGVTPVLIALDALVFIVNSANPLESISKAQVLELFSGALRSWESLGGGDSPVVLVSKERGRATLDLFEAYTGLNHPARTEAGSEGKIDAAALEIAANLEAITLVGGIPNAVGYVSLGAAEALISQGMPIKILPLEGVSPTRENLLSQKYPILRELNLLVQEPNERTERFIDLFFDEEMQQFLTRNGFIPMQRQVR